MSLVRRAQAADAAELVRLRETVITGGTGTWQKNALATLRRHLSDPAASLAAYVVDAPDESNRLAACAVGAIDQRLEGHACPTGQVGFVFNVTTDLGHRRRGYARACMQALLAWFQRRGITLVDLRCSPEAEPLYRSLGFVCLPDPAMRLALPADG
ncbi:GNAT family N-acetyltransferase [Saccharopolyspora phatthalungensis]|uniref:GNAT superfamily N-acetyltransferase n=1 Tax=Saccharopolyspora phatthalungensis TaxID=664693 RepID=A0A840QJR5_9PSEU|nr:GNAT family N-acetyltransferase [Saccharopolyspora phatthalungensis]MBB5158233.1 GNAT superfamily N-acetyltransferase [Saccharopolyspora phatthalungensis]